MGNAAERNSVLREHLPRAALEVDVAVRDDAGAGAAGLLLLLLLRVCGLHLTETGTLPSSIEGRGGTRTQDAAQDARRSV